MVARSIGDPEQAPAPPRDQRRLRPFSRRYPINTMYNRPVGAFIHRNPVSTGSFVDFIIYPNGPRMPASAARARWERLENKSSVNSGGLGLRPVRRLVSWRERNNLAARFELPLPCRSKDGKPIVFVLGGKLFSNLPYFFHYQIFVTVRHRRQRLKQFHRSADNRTFKARPAAQSPHRLDDGGICNVLTNPGALPSPSPGWDARLNNLGSSSLDKPQVLP